MVITLRYIVSGSFGVAHNWSTCWRTRNMHFFFFCIKM